MQTKIDINNFTRMWHFLKEIPKVLMLGMYYLKTTDCGFLKHFELLCQGYLKLCHSESVDFEVLLPFSLAP